MVDEVKVTVGGRYDGCYDGRWVEGHKKKVMEAGWDGNDKMPKTKDLLYKNSIFLNPKFFYV